MLGKTSKRYIVSSLVPVRGMRDLKAEDTVSTKPSVGRYEQDKVEIPEVRSCHIFTFFYGNSLEGSKHNDIRFYLTNL